MQRANTTVATTTASITRRPTRIINRRRPALTTTLTAPTTTTTTTTKTTTSKFYIDDDTLQQIDDTDAYEDPILVRRNLKSSNKVQRRPLILKDQDQNPSATTDDQKKRQSKKYSASIKQNQLDDLVKRVNEESSTERKTTTVEDISPETAVALAAHQLITAPVPIETDFEDDDVKPTRKIQTTVEYKYTSREYNEYTDTDTKTPSYDVYQSTPYYKPNILENDEFDSDKASDFDASRGTLQKYSSTPKYKTIDYVETTKSDSYTDFSTYDGPKSTHFPSTIDPEYTRPSSKEYAEPEFDTPKVTPAYFASKTQSTTIPTNTIANVYMKPHTIDDTTNEFDSRLLKFLPKSDIDYPTSRTYPEGSNGFISRNSPNYRTSTYPNIAIEENEPRSKISTTLSPPTFRNYFERATATLAENTPRFATFAPRGTKNRKGVDSDVSANVVTDGLSGIQRGSSKFGNEKLIPVPVEDGEIATAGYNSQEYFTRDYLLESPVTKAYDEKSQYIFPTTPRVPSTATRKVIRKKIQRKISTTQRPTTTTSSPTTTTTVVPPRVPAKPKVPKEKTRHKPISTYDYYDDGESTLVQKYDRETKVVMHGDGIIECLDIGNFPHPTSCKKFISCARIDNGSLLGWEYFCPKGLSFDPIGGICNWSAGLGCQE